MPLFVELADPAMTLRNKYTKILFAESIFEMPDSLGDFESTGIITNDQFTSVLDGEPVVRHYNNFTINVGHTVIPTLRCKGMCLFIDGDLTVNGTLSMTARGAKAPGKYVGIDPILNLIYHHSTDIFLENGIYRISKDGGLRTAYPANNTRLNGNPGVNGACGSGGTGSRHVNTGSGNAGRGGPGTSFSGGPGGGALCILGTNVNAGDGAIDGGVGGGGKAFDNTGWTKCAGGGAGNAGGAGNTYNGGFANTGSTGTGGLMILIVRGRIIINPGGSIQSKGSNGGSAQGSNQNDRAWGQGGGASGGGAIHIFTPEEITNPQLISVAGGIGGVCYNGPGGNGGLGSLAINQLAA